MPNKSGMNINRIDSAPHRLHYAWIVLAVTFACLFFAAAVRSLPGILMLALEREFGWSRDAISGAVAVNLLLFGVSGPWLGRWMDLYGPKRVCLASIALLALAAGACAMARELWQWYLLWGIIAGIGSGGRRSCWVRLWSAAGFWSAGGWRSEFSGRPFHRGN
jgi:MFS family permease